MSVTDYPSLASLIRALANRETSSAEYAETLIARTATHTALGGYVGFDPDLLRAQARVADSRRSAGETVPLLGMPIALKDNIDAVGWPTSVGTTALLDNKPSRDAAVTERLRAAGALISGKANMHELAFGITNHNRVTGIARNPWATDRIPGGSSGGCGVLVAAGLVPAAIGTDTGGSVRVPAALCGIAGLRPTVGRVSGRGIAPISSTRDTAGPMARCTEDLALLDTVLTGDAEPVAPISLAGLRLGLPSGRFWQGLDGGVSTVTQAALELLRRAGVVLVDVDLPELDQHNEAAGFPIALYEFIPDMTRYLESSASGISLAELVARIGNQDVAGLLQPLLASGGIPQDTYAMALTAREKLQQVYSTAFAKYQVEALVFPTTPLTARAVSPQDTVEFNGQQQPSFPTFIRNTDPGSNAGIPGVTLPAGMAPDGLPVGLALDGPAHSDRRLLSVAAAIERVLPKPTLAPL
ncbi:indoleacetamide hydrolase [Rhodoferax sediminis]|uniref:Indoleacetamide hydrolase n=1 Tax=Rhodoferax sediminis TaxID=2509614 RepID=A0A515DCE0_9BURK|nr:indoleacetamide hydrolase [Rhodoferax sediminis]QDL38067.1 indoleacetamide hydrolase [Rhodoferax sediminis]